MNGVIKRQQCQGCYPERLVTSDVDCLKFDSDTKFEDNMKMVHICWFSNSILYLYGGFATSRGLIVRCGEDGAVFKLRFFFVLCANNICSVTMTPWSWNVFIFLFRIGQGGAWECDQGSQRRTRWKSACYRSLFFEQKLASDTSDHVRGMIQDPHEVKEESMLMQRKLV